MIVKKESDERWTSMPYFYHMNNIIRHVGKLTVTCLLLMARFDTLLASSSEEGVSQQQQQQQCGIYFAPSSISNSGYGMFSGIEREKDSIFHDLPCLMFPMDNFLEIHNLNTPHTALSVAESYATDRSHSHFSKNEYLGQMFHMGGGFYAFPNSHSYHNNIQGFDAMYFDGLMNRANNPGAGAVSTHVSGMQATVKIKAGEELLLDYGDNYFLVRESLFNKTHITKVDYDKALEIVYDIAQFQRKSTCSFGDPMVQLIKTRLLPYHEEGEKLAKAYPDDISSWNFTNPIGSKEFNMEHSNIGLEIFNLVAEFHKNVTINANDKSTVSFDRCVSLFKDIMKAINHRIAAALPANEVDLNFILENGITSLDVKKEERIRDLVWLEQNGICLDNIVLKTSEISMAGFGAVSRRPLEKGAVVDATPLVPIDDITYLDMYKFDLHKRMKYDQLFGHQLMMNYCFGHKKSSLLLCMLTSSAFINHKAEGKGANVEYRWASWAEDDTQEALKMPLEELKRVPYRKLALEMVALRDIAEGEELYMDYGKEWEMAWDKHVNEWTSPTGVFADHIPVKHVMRRNNGKPYKTLIEQKFDPYPHSIGMECYMNLEYLVKEGYYPPKDVEVPTTEELEILSSSATDQITLKKMIERFAVKNIYFFEEEGGDAFLVSNLYKNFLYWQPCDILEGIHANYTVRYYNHKEEGLTKTMIGEIPLIVRNVPHDAIRYTTKPYRTDRFIPGVFRHPIMLRDELFPSQWKDLDL